MSKRSRFAGTFKLGGIRWVVRKYWRNGEERYCYAPNHSYEPVFSKTPLTKEQIKDACIKQDLSIQGVNA